MKILSFVFVVFLASLMTACHSSSSYFQPARKSPFRALAYPLVTIDPYTGAWSFTDPLNAGDVWHWNGKLFPLSGFIQVDGIASRFRGTGSYRAGENLLEAALQQTVRVMPTPVNYLTYRVESWDKPSHEICFDLTTGLDGACKRVSAWLCNFLFIS